MTNSDWTPGEADERTAQILRGVLERYRAFWPMPVRQAFYQVVKAGGAGLWLDEYGNFLRSVRAGLVGGLLPTAAIADEAHEVREGGAWEDPSEFVHSEIESFLWGYRRNLLDGQERHVEVWVQKPALLDQVSEVAVEYCVTTVTCRRTPTPKFMDELRGRLAAARERHPSGVVLFFGDYSPGDTSFLQRVRETLHAEGNVWETEFRQEAVVADDVARHELPESVASRSRRSHAAADPTRSPVELEAFAPDVLADRVRAAIEAQLDMSLVNNQRALQSREALRLGKLRASILRQIRATLRDFMPREEA